MYSPFIPIAWPSSSGFGSATGSFTTVSRLPQEDKNACAGLTEVFADIDLRIDRLLSFGTLIGREVRIARVLDSRLGASSGAAVAEVGDITGETSLSNELSKVFPSGIACGGDTATLLDRLPMLSDRLLLPSGEAGELGPSSDCRKVDTDAGDTPSARLLFGVSITLRVALLSSDRLS